MGKKRRWALAGLLLLGAACSGCQSQMREDFDLLRCNGNPQTTMDYAARLQARKAKQQGRNSEASSSNTDDEDRAADRDQ